MTEMSDEEFLAQLKAEREITKTLLRYARGSDRKDFELMGSAYHPGAIDHHGPCNGSIENFVEWCHGHHEKYDTMMHMLGHPLIEWQGDIAFTETYCLIFQKLKPEATYAGEVSIDVFIACRYVDKFECRNGEWKIAERNVVYDWVKKNWDTQQNSPHQIGGEGFIIGQRSMEDMVYKIREK